MRLQALGSIPKPVIRCCVLRKTLHAYFPLGTNSQPVVEAQPDKTLANRARKSRSATLVWLDHKLVFSRLETDSFIFFSLRFIFLEYAHLSN